MYVLCSAKNPDKWNTLAYIVDDATAELSCKTTNTFFDKFYLTGKYGISLSSINEYYKIIIYSYAK